MHFSCLFQFKIFNCSSSKSFPQRQQLPSIHWSIQYIQPSHKICFSTKSVLPQSLLPTLNCKLFKNWSTSISSSSMLYLILLCYIPILLSITYTSGFFYNLFFIIKFNFLKYVRTEGELCQRSRCLKISQVRPERVLFSLFPSNWF